MKNILSIIAALCALILAGCTKEAPQKEAEPKTVTVSVTMEEDTRISLTPNTATPHGLVLKWEDTDQLMLCFEYQDAMGNMNYVHNEAPIISSSIRENGKVANFTITIPAEIPSGGQFNLYAVYQKQHPSFNGGTFEVGQKVFKLEAFEDQSITLDKVGTQGIGITRPMLYFSKLNILNTLTPDIGKITLIHSGWIMAVHFKNTTGAKMALPRQISFRNPSNVKWSYNGYGTSDTIFDVGAQLFTATFEPSLILLINQNYNWLPLYGQELENGASIVFYRWVASKTSIPKLEGSIVVTNNNNAIVTSTFIPAKTVVLGKVYHIYTEWDGTNFKFVPAY